MSSLTGSRQLLLPGQSEGEPRLDCHHYHLPWAAVSVCVCVCESVCECECELWTTDKPRALQGLAAIQNYLRERTPKTVYLCARVLATLRFKEIYLIAVKSKQAANKKVCLPTPSPYDCLLHCRIIARLKIAEEKNA